MHVPLLVRGPGIAAASRTTVNVVGYDLLPTFADLVGATARLGPNLDGVSFRRFLLGGTPTEREINRPLYFHYPHYRISPPASALIVGDTKLMYWYEWPDQRFVYVVGADRKVTSRTVTLAYLDEGSAVVTGIEPGMKVVTEGAQNIRPGSTVAEASRARAENDAPGATEGGKKKGKGS